MSNLEAEMLPAEEPLAGDPDLSDEGEERDPADLVANGLRPVWTREDGHLGTPPEDIRDEIALCTSSLAKSSNAPHIEQKITSSLGGQLLFRGMSRRALACWVALVTPTVNANNFDNELGPGVYTSPSLSTAINYAGLKVVVLVFQDPDFRQLEIREPTARTIPQEGSVAFMKA